MWLCHLCYFSIEVLTWSEKHEKLWKMKIEVEKNLGKWYETWKMGEPPQLDFLLTIQLLLVLLTEVGSNGRFKSRFRLIFIHVKLVGGFSFETTRNNEQIPANFIFKTRMHSSRMRTGRSLIVCRSLLPRGVCSRGSARGGYNSMHWGRPPLNRMTDRCKNITLPQTSFSFGKNTEFSINLKT